MKLEIRQTELKKTLFAASFGLILSVSLSACDSAVITAPDDGMGTNPEVNEVIIPDDATDLITTAENAGNFTVLLSAIQTAGLRDVLADENNVYTVFAPTDEAFNAIDEGALNALLADTEALTDTLQYHLLADRNTAAAITALEGQTISMLNNKDAAISLEGEDLRINTSVIAPADIIATNGIIHVIDTVLTPPATTSTPELTDNLSQLISNDPQFSTLNTAVQTAGLDSLLAEERDFTIFAPNNDAFSALGDETVNALLADPDTLRNILLNHVVENQLIDSTTATAAAGTTITSAANSPLSVSITDGNLLINTATVVRPDIAATNGVVHEISEVLQLPSGPTGTIIDVLNEDPDYSALVSLIQTANLEETLKDVNAKFTVFAPNNAALTTATDALNAGYTSDPAALANLLLGHVHDNTLSSVQVTGLADTELTMANGSSKTITVTNGSVMIDGATVIAADKNAQNGVIHGIDAVLLP